MDDRILDLVSDLGEPQRRIWASGRIAEFLGGEALLLFVRDDQLDVLLPAPGFPQTVPGGPSWRSLLSRCLTSRIVTGEVAFPTADQLRPATAVTDDCGLSAVLIGGQPTPAALGDLHRLLRLCAAVLRAEQTAAVAHGGAAVAREQAQHAHHLSLALESARSDLERALGESARLNRELQRADRIKDEFLATLAHELRNPLAALSGAIYLTRTKLAPDHPAAHSVTIAVRQADRLARLVDDLMDVSRITHGKIELQIQPLAVDEILRRAVESVRPHVDARRHHLVLRSDDTTSWIAADALRVEQIVVNLLTNAVKYTNPGGQIALSARRMEDPNDRRICLTVKDNGSGISSEVLPQVFELFKQVDHSQEKSQGGLGIGLTLVRKLVEMQGGTVSVSSEGLGKGTQVSVCFPIIPAPVGQAGTQSAQEPGPRSLACKVLIVDDNDDAAQMVSEFIAMWGYESRVVNDGTTALSESELFKPDVVLLDIGLPDISGYEVASRIKQRQSRNPPLLVALTGYGQPADRQRSAEAGFDEHFTKPLDLKKLERLLATQNPPATTAKPR